MLSNANRQKIPRFNGQFGPGHQTDTGRHVHKEQRLMANDLKAREGLCLHDLVRIAGQVELALRARGIGVVQLLPGVITDRGRLVFAIRYFPGLHRLHDAVSTGSGTDERGPYRVLEWRACESGLVVWREYP